MLEPFKDFLAREMERQGHSQADTVRLTGLSQGSVSQHLSGSREPNLGALARYFPVYPYVMGWAASRIVDGLLPGES